MVVDLLSGFKLMSQLYNQNQVQQSAATNQQQGAPQRQQSQTQQPVSQQFQTRSYLSQNVRKTSVQRLNRCLADTVVLHSQVKYAHWNVKGPQFAALHELFDDIAEDLEDQIDDIAERATALGGQALGGTYTAASNATIPPLSTQAVTGMEFIEMLADQLALHDANLSQDIQAAQQAGDVDTVDLLNEISREVAEQLWFLEAHLQGQPAQTGTTPQSPVPGQ